MNDLIELDENHNKFLDKPNTLCRYEDIRTYQYNKVQINSANKYINASWIHIPYPNFFIATQGPLSHTTEDFWTMCDEYDIEAIVMLCKLKEKNVEKCAKYWDNNIKMENLLLFKGKLMIILKAPEDHIFYGYDALSEIVNKMKYATYDDQMALDDMKLKS